MIGNIIQSYLYYNLISEKVKSLQNKKNGQFKANV